MKKWQTVSHFTNCWNYLKRKSLLKWFKRNQLNNKWTNNTSMTSTSTFNTCSIRLRTHNLPKKLPFISSTIRFRSLCKKTLNNSLFSLISFLSSISSNRFLLSILLWTKSEWPFRTEWMSDSMPKVLFSYTINLNQSIHSWNPWHFISSFHSFWEANNTVSSFTAYSWWSLKTQSRSWKYWKELSSRFRLHHTQLIN